MCTWFFILRIDSQNQVPSWGQRNNIPVHSHACNALCYIYSWFVFQLPHIQPTRDTRSQLLLTMVEGIHHNAYNGNKNISPLTQPTVCNSAISIRNTLVILISWTLKLQVPAISRYWRYNYYILSDNCRYRYPPFTMQDNTRLLREKNVCSA